MWITILRTMILFIGVLYGVSTGADVLLEQRHDTNNQVLSFWHPVAGFQAGDDYIPSRRTRITSVTFWMIATWPEVPYNWSFAVHRSTTDHSFFDFAPEYPWFHFQTGPTSVIDLGDWAGRAGTHLFEVRFDNVDLILDPADSEQGTFWFSPGGWTQNTNISKSWWLTAGNGVVNGNETWGKHYPLYQFPGWLPLSNYGPPPPATTPCGSRAW
ncbi:MAG: hypothetical protein HRU76_09100 [Phycisphaeraceae bacterium]|nr:MAG: hypothetical protein HRU76_09100 [Phycisphaeraceae bacterium]